ncbi:MAG: hypothetical protein WA885_21690 [Phormidesmis sp.]
MSAFTFQRLSTEVTQALTEQSDTPPDTIARCTLGRDKVMVLIEYPLDSAQAEPLAGQTLDWLEQHLRDQFDTTGLPEEAAELADAGEEVPVQLFLKHRSEPKPFTMRSFVWKLADSFEDLFGQPQFDPQPSTQPQIGTLATPFRGRYSTYATARDEVPIFHNPMDVEISAGTFAPDGDHEPVPSELDDEHLQLELESDSPLASDLEMQSDLDLELDLAEQSNLQSNLELNFGAGLMPALDPDSDFDAELEADADDFEADDFATGFEVNDFDASTTAHSITLEHPVYEASSSTLDDDLDDDLDGAIADELEGDWQGEDEQESQVDFNLDAESDTELDSETALEADLATGIVVPLESESSSFELPSVDLPFTAKTDEDAASSFFDLSEDITFISAESTVEDEIFDPSETELLKEELSGSQPLTYDYAGMTSSVFIPRHEEFATEALAESPAEEAALEVEPTALTPALTEAEMEAEMEAELEAEPETELDFAEITDSLSSEDFGRDRTYEADVDALEALMFEEGTGHGTGHGEDDVQATNDAGVSAYPYEAEEHAFAADFNTDPTADREAYSDGNDADESDEGDLEDNADSTEADDSELDADEDGQADYEDDPDYYLEGHADEDEAFEDVALVDEQEVQRQREQWQQQTKRSPWIFVGAMGFIVVGILGHVLTRPCSFGASCDRIQTAQVVGDEAISDLRVDASLDGVTTAKQRLKRAIAQLAPIPIWSPYYSDAQAVLPTYRAQLRALDQVSDAQTKAYRAAVNSQNPPHSVATWQSIADDWQAASLALESVPDDSPVRELADRKLLEYRANRATILVRINTESKAEVSIRQAQQAASLATKKVETAGSLEDWEDALTSWESAVNNLSQIPQGTKAHGEAQNILPDYLKQLDEVRDRTEQERSASRELSKAKQLAASAQRAETEEQWTISAENWKNAIGQLGDVSAGTLAHAEAQALLGIYNSAYNKAENNLQVALRFQPIEPEFFVACGAANAQKCTYSVRNGNVRLDVFQGYDSVIDQSITPPDQRAAVTPTEPLIGQANQLLQDITLLSTKAQVPVELYDAQGTFMARYRPDLNGFVRDAAVATQPSDNS